MRLIFMGTPDFSVPVLSALLDAGHRVVGVYSQPPRPAGRGQRERPSPVHAFAADRGLPVHTPASLKDAAGHGTFAKPGADAAVVAAYGLILPRPILEAPVRGCINVHASLLPRWRGAAPIQRAIMAGDNETGVTIMQMDEGLDTGPMLLAEKVAITATTTASDLHDALAALGARLVIAALDGIAAGRLAPVPQPDDGVTLAPRIDPAEARLDWRRPAVELERIVRALNPWPGTWFEHDGRRIKVLACEAGDGAGDPGTVLDDRLGVACGCGTLRPTRLQRPGKAPMDGAAFLRGYPVAAGEYLAPCARATR